MKRLLAALAGLLGIAWLRRRQPALGPAPAYERAEELRAKLAQARGTDDREQVEAGGTPAAESVDARRREVHDRARSAIDEMHGE